MSVCVWGGGCLVEEADSLTQKGVGSWGKLHNGPNCRRSLRECIEAAYDPDTPGIPFLVYLTDRSVI